MNTKFIAHRGYSKLERENTLPAFKLASVNPEFYGIETDVHKTLDGVYVLLHDAVVTRVTLEHDTTNVEQETYENVKKIRLAEMNGEFNNPELYPPIMEDYFKICKESGKVAVFELKQDFEEDDLCEMVKRINDLGMLNQTVFISFILSALLRLRKLYPEVTIQWLLAKPIEKEMIDIMVENKFGVDIVHTALNQEVIDECHNNGITVNAWTVDSVERAKELVGFGIDMITSNWIKPSDLK